MAEGEQKLSVVHAEDGVYESGGLREQFVYRDLGINAATGGKYNAHVIRGGAGEPPIEPHMHIGIDFQMVYVTRGWVTFWYEDKGEETMRAGSCHLLPPGIKHSVVGWSDDIEMVEITSPTDYGTELVAAE